jgi:O-antigen/teichoic acid export membrane protein
MAPKLKTSFVYNMVGALVPVASAFVTVPLYIHVVGVDRYGMVAISGLLLGYFGFLDFGLSRASANALSRLSHASAAERSPVIMTALYLNLALGLLGGLAMFAAGHWLLEHVFQIPEKLRDETLSAFPWVAAMLPVGMLSGVANGVLESRDRFLITNLLNSVGNVLGQLMPLAIAMFISPTLPYVIPTMLLVRLAMVGATFAIVFRIEWPVRLLDFHRAWIRRLFSYGAWVSISSLISPLLDGFDQMLIGAVLGPAATAHYSVPMNLSMRSQIVAVALARALFPQLSRAEPAEARRLAQHACVGLAYGFGAICGPAILVSAAFLEAWVGKEFATSAAPVAAILLAGAWVNGLAFIPYSLIQGQGRPDITAKVHLIEIVPFVVLLWFMTQWYGLPGAAWAWIMRVAADCITLMLLSGFPRALAWKFAPPAVLMGICYLLAVYSSSYPIVVALAAGALFFIFGLIMEPLLRHAVTAVVVGCLQKWSRNR